MLRFFFGMVKGSVQNKHLSGKSTVHGVVIYGEDAYRKKVVF